MMPVYTLSRKRHTDAERREADMHEPLLISAIVLLLAQLVWYDQNED